MSEVIYGASVYVTVYGNGGGDSVDMQCDVSDYAQYLCPFGMFEMKPPKEGMRCACRDDGCGCNRLAARVAALKRAEKIVKAEIKRITSEMDG